MSVRLVRAQLGVMCRRWTHVDAVLLPSAVQLQGCVGWDGMQCLAAPLHAEITGSQGLCQILGLKALTGSFKAQKCSAC